MIWEYLNNTLQFSTLQSFNQGAVVWCKRENVVLDLRQPAREAQLKVYDI